MELLDKEGVPLWMTQQRFTQADLQASAKAEAAGLSNQNDGANGEWARVAGECLLFSMRGGGGTGSR